MGQAGGRERMGRCPVKDLAMSRTGAPNRKHVGTEHAAARGWRSAAGVHANPRRPVGNATRLPYCSTSSCTRG